MRCYPTDKKRHKFKNSSLQSSSFSHLPPPSKTKLTNTESENRIEENDENKSYTRYMFLNAILPKKDILNEKIQYDVNVLSRPEIVLSIFLEFIRMVLIQKYLHLMLRKEQNFIKL